MTPPAGTVQRWAWDFILSEQLAVKTQPPPLPSTWELQPPVRDRRPGPRPTELTVRAKTRTARAKSLEQPSSRAKLFHSFWHHELQAAELMCWALLRFPESERAFHSGLIQVCQDEIRHMALYAGHIKDLGFSLGDFPVRDWFWERVPTCQSAIQYVALMGMGLEAANLDHGATYAAEFDQVGDSAGAAIQTRVVQEEIGHTRFAARWFETWTGSTDFERWQAELPPPLSPLLMRGKSINASGRRLAGLSEGFINDLSAWRPVTPRNGSEES